jgi:hypothetical protein
MRLNNEKQSILAGEARSVQDVVSISPASVMAAV